MKINRLSFALFLGCFFPVLAYANTTVTGTILNLDTTTPGTTSWVRFWLRGCRGNTPRITGTGAIAPQSAGTAFYVDVPANGSGVVSGTIYSTRDAAGTGNGDIECGGSYTAVFYGMQIYNNNVPGPEVPVHAKKTATLDISNVTPITIPPVVTAPTGDSTYARLDGGNQNFTGAIGAPSATISGALTAGSVTSAPFTGPSPWYDVTAPAYGAGTGLTNNATAFQAAITAATTNGGRIFVPCGTYAFTAAVTMAANIRFVGAHRGCVTLNFTGATDGITVADGVNNWAIEGITLSTSNASAGKALALNGSASGVVNWHVRDVTVLQSGSGRWTYGFYATFAEIGDVISLRIGAVTGSGSATNGIYVNNSTNQVTFINPEVTGGISSDHTFNRGFWSDTTAGSEVNILGGTFQGCFSLGSAIFVTSNNARLNGVHAEGNCAAADGGDIVISGASDVHIYGGFIAQQLILTGTIRGFSADGIVAGDVTFGASAFGAFILNSRVNSITDNGTVLSASNNGNGWINVRNSAGNPFRNKYSGMEQDLPGSTSASLAGGPANAAGAFANNTGLYWRDSGGTNREAIQWTAADQLIETYLAGNVLVWRNSTPTNKLVLSDTSFQLQSGVNFDANGQSVQNYATITSKTNCAAVGSAANPSVASCSAAPAGAFSCATNASGGTCQVNTTAVTANSEIIVQQVSYVGARLGVTCNTSSVLPAGPLVTSISAGASFTISLGTVTTNPGCFIYSIVN